MQTTQYWFNDDSLCLDGANYVSACNACHPAIWKRKKSLLIKLFIIFIVGHILSVIAWNFWILLLARMCIALAHSVFWSITASLVMRIAPKHKKTQALGMLAIGTALATILGLPIGTDCRTARRLACHLQHYCSTGIIHYVFNYSDYCQIYPVKMLALLQVYPCLPKRPLLLWLYVTTADRHFSTLYRLYLYRTL